MTILFDCPYCDYKGSEGLQHLKEHHPEHFYEEGDDDLINEFLEEIMNDEVPCR